MDNPGDSKYGMTAEQIGQAFKILKEKGAKHFGIHAFLASNTVTNEYYPMLAKILFELAVKLKEELSLIHIYGGIQLVVSVHRFMYATWFPGRGCRQPRGAFRFRGPPGNSLFSGSSGLWPA